MAKKRQRRSSGRATTTPQPAHARATRGRQPAPLIIAGLVVIGLVLWWGVSSLTPTDADSTGSVEPIATVESPDYHSLLVDPQNPEHLLFGSHTGVQESHDGGATWEAGTLRDADAMQLSVSPEAPETIYATGHDVFQVSHDGGQTWQALEHTLPGTDIHGFAQDTSDPEQLFAFVVGAGVYGSTDAGGTWDPLPTQPPGGGMHVALAASGESLYAATEAGLVVSRDDGRTWDTLAGQPSSQVISLAVAASDPQALYAGTPSGLAKSTDGGSNWSDVGPDGVVVLAVAATPGDPDRVFVLSDAGGIYASDDGGQTWR